MSAAGPAAARVLVVGDANADLILRGDVVPRFGQAEQLLDDAVLTLGGSAAITAHGLARLGRPVSLVAAVGRDAFGEQVRHDLATAGVVVDAVAKRSGDPTGLTVVLSRSDDRAILTRPGAIPTLTADEVRAAIRATPDLAHVHVSSLFLQPQLALDLPELLAEIRAGGVTTSLDTNDDPSGGWSGVDTLLAHLDVLLPNRAEAIALARAVSGGDATDLASAAARLASTGPLVVVKDGARGAHAVDPAGRVTSAPAQPRTPLDTTGAGDTFNAAFLDAWLARCPLGECLRRAVLAGSLSVAALGGTARQPSPTDLHILERTP